MTGHPAREAQAQDPVVVSVDDGESRRRESFEEFSLRCTDIVDGAEFVEMSWCDSCDDADFRPGNGCQPADLADAGRGQFEHGELIVGRDAEQTQRDSEVIVEVLRALRAGEPAGEHRVNHVSCGRLADAAGHPDGDRVHLFAVPGGELSEGGGGVADFDQQSVMVDVSSRFDDAGGCPIGKGLRDKVVTVVPFAFECPEQITAFHLPGVGLDTVEAVFRKVVAGSHAGSGGGDKLLKRHRWHSLARCRRNIRLGGCLVRPVQVHEPGPYTDVLFPLFDTRPGQLTPADDAIVEGDLSGSDRLAGFVSLAGNQHGVARHGHVEGAADGLLAIRLGDGAGGDRSRCRSRSRG